MRRWLAFIVTIVTIAGGASARADAPPKIPGVTFPAVDESALAAARAEKRMALVIGNSAYPDAPLHKPRQDARSMAAVLAWLGYQVTLREDLSGEAMERELNAFTARLKSSGAQGLFYYSGHGIQGQSGYLAPVDLSIHVDEITLRHRTLSVEQVLSRMETARDGVDIVIIDACRNNPYVRGVKGAAAGVQPVPAGKRSLTAFATRLGATASEGPMSEPHSVFTHRLLPAMLRPGAKVRDVLDEVQDEVRREMKEKQLPVYDSSLGALPVFFLPPGKASLSPIKTPRTVDDRWANVEPGKSYTLRVLDNDAAAQGGALRVASVGGVSRGRAEVAGDGRSVTYSAPVDGLAGEVSFVYRVREDGGGEAEGRVTLALTAPPKPEPPRSNVIPVVGVFPEAKSVFKDCGDCPEMVVVPAGSFMMGSPGNEPDRFGDEGPQRTVRIPQDFAVGRYEVIQAEWRSVMGSNPSNFKGNRLPVEKVSWDEAKEFVKRLNAKTGQTYRLLTEAEWEYAARAGTTTPFSTGWMISADQANFNGNDTHNGGAKGTYRQMTTRVGNFPANAFGLHDMYGNVYEWVEDCYVDSYRNARADGSAVTGKNSCQRVVRGGSWSSVPRNFRSASRLKFHPDLRYSHLGFRVARTLP